MSSRYTADGKRRSSQTHARRSHPCSLCDASPSGNGGVVAHGRGHVRRGEAVELVKHFGTYPPMSNRVFLAVDDPGIPDWLARGYEKVTR